MQKRIPGAVRFNLVLGRQSRNKLSVHLHLDARVSRPKMRGGLVITAHALLTHQYQPVNHASIGSEDHCACGFRPRGWTEWVWHVEELGL